MKGDTVASVANINSLKTKLFGTLFNMCINAKTVATAANAHKLCWGIAQTTGNGANTNMATSATANRIVFDNLGAAAA